MEQIMKIIGDYPALLALPYFGIGILALAGNAYWNRNLSKGDGSVEPFAILLFWPVFLIGAILFLIIIVPDKFSELLKKYFKDK
jgi:hypothetical protein